MKGGCPIFQFCEVVVTNNKAIVQSVFAADIGVRSCTSLQPKYILFLLVML